MTAKLMELRRPDRCAECDAELAIGTEAYWIKTRRVVVCTACYVAPETSAGPADAPSSPESDDHSPAGVAGGSALGDEFGDVPVRGVLCFIGCDWGFRMKAKELRGVKIVWPLAVPELVAADGPHATRVAAAADRLRSQLRPARAG